MGIDVLGAMPFQRGRHAAESLRDLAEMGGLQHGWHIDRLLDGATHADVRQFRMLDKSVPRPVLQPSRR